MSPGTAWPQGSALAQGSGITVPELAAEALGSFLTTHINRSLDRRTRHYFEPYDVFCNCSKDGRQVVN